MINVLVSIRVAPSGEAARPEIEGDVRLLRDVPSGDVPAPVTGEPLPFAGWLQLLGRLEQLALQASSQT